MKREFSDVRERIERIFQMKKFEKKERHNGFRSPIIIRKKTGNYEVYFLVLNSYKMKLMSYV